MSQAGALNGNGGGGGSNVQTLTGNTGGAVPPTANNINTVGTGSITVAGNAGTSTLTAQLTGLTNHNVLVGAGTATITNVPPSTAGFVLTSNGPGADPSFQAASGSGAITQIDGDIGSATGSTITFAGLPHAGASVTFQAGAAQVDLYTCDAGGNMIVGEGSGNGSITGFSNVALGQSSAAGLSSGSSNVAVGNSSLGALDTGSFNVAVGSSSGVNFTTSESGNICINHQGVVSESNVLRIGDPLSGTQFLSAAYIAGIAGVTVSNTNIVTIDTMTGQLGSQAPGGSSVYFEAYLSTTVTGIAFGSFSTLVFDATIVNAGSGYNTSTGQFTAPSTGLYTFSTTEWIGNAGGANGSVIIKRLGSAESSRMFQEDFSILDGGGVILTNAWMQYMTAGDTVEVQTLLAGTGTYDIFGNPPAGGTEQISVFTGCKIA